MISDTPEKIESLIDEFQVSILEMRDAMRTLEESLKNLVNVMSILAEVKKEK